MYPKKASQNTKSAMQSDPVQEMAVENDPTKGELQLTMLLSVPYLLSVPAFTVSQLHL